MPKLLRVHFRCRSLHQFAREYLEDFGEESIFIRTRTLLPCGTPLVLDLRLEDGAPLLEGRGTVLFATAEVAGLELAAGMEIQLDELTPESARVRRWLLAHRARQRLVSVGRAHSFRDTLPGLGEPRAPRPASTPALPEPPALGARGTNFFTGSTDPELDAAAASNPGERVFLLSPHAGGDAKLAPMGESKP
jgi:hypothetical protein